MKDTLALRLRELRDIYYARLEDISIISTKNERIEEARLNYENELSTQIQELNELINWVDHL